jgi:hypothetical protein
MESVDATCAGITFPKSERLFAKHPAGSWRTFEVTTRVEVLDPSGLTRVWLPAALVGHTPFQKTLSNSFNTEGRTAKMVENKSDSIGIVVAEFSGGTKPVLTLTSRISIRDYAVNLSQPGRAPKPDRAELEHLPLAHEASADRWHC